jgi:glycosyltransferase involved in cell wall biosynthesis
MKLLYVDNALAIYGGIERVLTDKLNWLVEYGDCEICLLTANQGNHPIVFPLSDKVEFHDLGIMFHQVYNYSGWKRYRLLMRLHRLFRQRINEMIRIFTPDVIVCARLDCVYDVIKERGRIPVVFESHHSFLAYKFEKYSWLQILQIKHWHRVLKKAQMIITLSKGDALEWKKINPHVQVIPNVVHLNNTGRYSTCNCKSVIFVGRYSFQKDIESLLQIWKIVNQRHPDWQLNIYGGYGDQQEILQSIIYRSERNIVIHQPTSLIYDELLKSSILLMTSRYEPFGLVLPEAMSCGLPVVAFDCPYGPADIVTDGVDGFLIKNRNIEEYADKVCILIEHEDLRRRFGKAGVLSSQRYRADNVMPQWVSLFNQLSNKIVI